MTLLDSSARGVFLIAPTPFQENGALALDDIPRMVDFFLARGVNGFTILGMMGEAVKLTETESRSVVEAFLKAVGARVPVVVGMPAAGFAAMQSLAAHAMDRGAAGVMVAPPTGLKGDEVVLRHYQTVAETLGGTPFVLQDFPQSTGVAMSAGVIRAIVDAVPSCVMLKHEDWPGLGKLSQLRRAEAAGTRRISILVGNGGVFLPDELRRGADGAMTGFAFPEMMRDVIAAHAAGDSARAADIFDAYLPLARYEQQPGPGLAVRKHILMQRGALSTAALRRPGTALSGEDFADVAFLLERQERRLAALGITL